MNPATFEPAARPGAALLLATAMSALPALAQNPPAPAAPSNESTLQDTRTALGKWIETQQIIAKERKDWQQGKEILLSRLDLVKKEIASLKEKVQQAEASVAKATEKREALLAENATLKAADAQLATAVATVEGDVKKLFAALPSPLQTKVQPLYQRMPTETTTARVSTAERLQNVLVILNEVHKANSEVTVNYEVQTLADGRRSEVQALYIGLGQAYYVSADGEAGIGRPASDGWRWEARNTIHGDLTVALDILQGKHTPAFVPLPVTLQ